MVTSRLALTRLAAEARSQHSLPCASHHGRGCGGGGRGGGASGPGFDRAAVDRAAAERAGLTLQEAFSIDEVEGGLYARLGLDTLKKFSTAFYTSFYNDKPFYEELFKDHPLEASIQNQYEFLAQRFGGPKLYMERKGPPRMLQRHAAFPCNETTAEAWLRHSEVAFGAVPEIDADSRERMSRFFRWMAYFLVEGQAARKEAGAGQGSGAGQGAGRGQGFGAGQGAGRGQGFGQAHAVA